MIFQFGFGYSSQNAIFWLESIGLRDVILPFILFFTILYGLLQKVNVFGGTDGDSRKYNIIISLVISLLAIIPHVTGAYPSGLDVVDIVNTALPEIALLLIVITMTLVLVGALGGATKSSESAFFSIVAFISVIFLVVIMIRAFTPGYTSSFFYFLDDPGFQTLIVALIVFGVIVWFVTKKDDNNNNGSFGDAFIKLFNKRQP